MGLSLNKLIFTAADYKILLIIPGVGSFILQTAETYSHDVAREEEVIYAIGTVQPIGNKTNAVSYKGKLSIQVGELNAILQIGGYPEATFIQGATLAVAALNGTYSRTWSNLNINSESTGVKAKDKQTMAELAWTALGVS